MVWLVTPIVGVPLELSKRKAVPAFSPSVLMPSFAMAKTLDLSLPGVAATVISVQMVALPSFAVRV